MKSRLGLATAFVAGYTLIGSGSALADPVGMAAHVAGPVTVVRDGAAAPLHLLGRIQEGDTVRCGPGGMAALVLFGNGARFVVSAGTDGVVHASTVTGAKQLAALGGPSAEEVAVLGNARVGAMMARPAHSFERLLTNSPGWLIGTTPHIEWLPIEDAATYTFTLFDSHDDVVWSSQSTGTSADYPATAPPLQEKRTYMWRLSAFGTSGKPLAESRWGLITFLEQADADDLTQKAAALQAQAKAEGDNTPLLVLADLYRAYGVTGKTLETLESEGVRTEPGADDAKLDVYNSLSPFARVLAGVTVPGNQ